MSILNSSYWSAIKRHNVSTLFYGAAASRIIGLSVAPVLTRICGPAAFGEAAVFFSFVAILTVLVTGSYEKALLSSPDDKDLASTTALTMSLICFGVFVISLLMIVLPSELIFPSSEIVFKWKSWFPLAVGAMASAEVFGFWALREKQFKHLAISRTIQNTFSSIVQLLMGFLSFPTTGLVAGPVCGQVFYGFYWGRLGAVLKKQFIPFGNAQEMVRQFKRHWRFPVFTVPSNFFNTLAHKLPLLFFGAYFGNQTVGLISVGLAVGEAIIGLFGKPIEDVLGQRMGAEFIGSQSCQRTFKKGFVWLLLIGGVIFIPLGFLAPFVFPWVFGGDWKDIGVIIRILTPLYFVRFVVSPLSYVFYIVNKQEVDFFWQIGFLLMTILGLFLGVKSGSVKFTIVALVVARSLMYALYGFLSFRIVYLYTDKISSSKS